MKDNRMKNALDNIARRGVPGNLNLWPRIAARLDERKSTMRYTPLMRPMRPLAILIIIVTLLALTGAAYAIGRSLGYIPGVGIIDQSAPLRVLAEPVSRKRDGVTLTVASAVLSADKTVLFVKVENVPPDAYPMDESPGCLSSTILSLADGTTLTGGIVGASGWTHFETRLEYGAIPAGVNVAVLLVPCIGSTIQGALPENWEFPLRFVPAPPDMTAAPVIELSTPTAGAMSAPALSNSMTLNGITLTVEKFVEVENGYQLYGSLDLSGLQQGNASVPLALSPLMMTDADLTMTDANGNQIPFEEMQSEELQGDAVFDPNRISWVYRTNQKALAAPLMISLASVQMNAVAQMPFELDLGLNPQIGQTWEINRDLDLGGKVVRLLSARLEESSRPGLGSTLIFAYEDNGANITIGMEDKTSQTPVNGGGGGDSGGGGGGGGGSSFAWVNYYEEIPTGLRQFTISAAIPYSINGPWQVIWNPSLLSAPTP